MPYDPEKHHRQSIRMKGYDYSKAGLYFITICVNDKECLFGEIKEGTMILNEFGIIAQDEWFKSAEIRSEITMDCFIVMPNHIHGIVIIDRRGDRPVAPTNTGAPSGTGDRPGAPTGPTGSKPKSLGAFVAGYKSSVTKKINMMRKMPGVKVWQRNYHDHIIRNQEAYQRISAYIINNPSKWKDDTFYG